MTKSVSNENALSPSSGWEKRRLVKRSQIIKAATQLFTANGYAQVSMDAIVEAASVSKRTLYNYYESKDQLFLDAIKDQTETIWSAMAQKEESLPLDKRLLAIAQELVTVGMAREPLALYRIVIAEAQRFPDLTKQFYDVSIGRAINTVADLLEQEAAAFGLVIDDAHRASEFFIDLLTGAAYMRVVLALDKPMPRKQIEAHATNAVATFLKIYG